MELDASKNAPAHQRYGAQPLDAEGRDGYVTDTAKVARALGVIDPPTTEAELVEQLAAYRPELRGTAEARSAARFLLLRPPLHHLLDCFSNSLVRCIQHMRAFCRH